jgi:hypothetical protein
MGTSTAAAQAWTHASAIGRRAGPEGKSADRVDEREAVGAGGDHGARGRRNVPLSRGKLRVERLPRRGAGGRDELCGGVRCLVHVGAGEVQLEDGDVLLAVEPLADHGEVRRREPAHRDPELRPQSGEPREVGLEKGVDPGPLETDRVEHPALGLGDAHRRVAAARERRDRLRHERVEAAGHVGGDERVETAGGVEDPDAAHAAARRTGPSTHSRT